MIRLFLAAMFFATLPAVLDVFAGPPAPTGLWLTEKKGVVVDLYECGEGALCGRTVWLKKMNDSEGAPRLDVNNPDPALRGRHWCGIEVITGLRADGEGRWSGGKVYDPKTGSTFDFDLAREGDGLEARGYLGARLLGKSESWTRADPADFTPCPNA